MKWQEDFWCPHCDEFVPFEFSSDYFENEEGMYVEPTYCPKCGKKSYVSWETSVRFNISGDCDE